MSGGRARANGEGAIFPPPDDQASEPPPDEGSNPSGDLEGDQDPAGED